MYIFDRLIAVIFSCTILTFSQSVQAASLPWKTENMDCQVRRSDTGIGVFFEKVNEVRWYGRCLHGMAYGTGVAEYFRDRRLLATYKGQMEHGIAHGKGKFDNIRIRRKSPGVNYEGQFRDNEYHGQGKLTLFSDEIYVGQFHNHKYHGQGIIEHIDSVEYDGIEHKNVKYNGEFRNGDYQGMGTLMVGDLYYTGQFRAGKRHGQITITIDWGDLGKLPITYAGQVLDKKTGQQISSPPNGFSYTEYVGEFRNDKPHGLGAFILPSGEKHIGLWNYHCILSKRGNHSAKCASLIKSN